MEKAQSKAVDNFREYLRIKTVQPKPDYDAARRFLQRQADELELPCQVLELAEGKPIVIISWEGTNPTLPSVLLNSHIDVVPVYPEYWKYEPFSAHVDDNGDIYARGSQDMKCVGIQYIEAIRRLKNEGRRLLRTLHMSFVPDEETGGVDGMEGFVKTKEFQKLNIGFALDEGLANPTEAFKVYYGERMCCPLNVRCSGKPGHGSLFVEDDAGSKLRKVIDAFMDFRNQEESRLKNNPSLRLGDVTTINLTTISGGVQCNVVPAELKVGFDMRVPPTVDLAELKQKIEKWCRDAGEGVNFEFLKEPLKEVITPTTKDDKWWNAFSTSCEKLNMKLEVEIFPAGTDSIFLRNLGLPALGFSPMNKTPVLLHDHNEFLNQAVFLRGIDIYTDILSALGGVSD